MSVSRVKEVDANAWKSALGALGYEAKCTYVPNVKTFFQKLGLPTSGGVISSTRLSLNRTVSSKSWWWYIGSPILSM